MNENEKFYANRLARAVEWRLGCQELFGKELEGFDEDEIRECIYVKGRETLLSDRVLAYPTKTDTFEEFCERNILTYGTGDDLLTKKAIAEVYEKELRKAYEEVCTETDG